MFKRKKEPVVVQTTPDVSSGPSEKQRLLNLYAQLKELNVRSISDLENLIARTEE